MVKAMESGRLVNTKLALAQKYESLARAAQSTPKRKAFLHHAARFRRQAADLARK